MLRPSGTGLEFSVPQRLYFREEPRHQRAAMFLNGAFDEVRINLRQDILPGGISKLVGAIKTHDAARQPGKLGNLKCPLPNFVRPDYQEPGWRNLFKYARVVPCPVAKMKMQACQTLFFEEALFWRVLEC